METKDYLGTAFFVVMTILAFIVGIVTNNKPVLVAAYIFIVMAQVAYLIAYVKTIKKEVDSIKQLLVKK
ncbi:MAG: hypothetical protein A2W30_00015 [Ignavibacteria bacterium RBG_16_36_9]|nr:MAG: hypothetical protein A2W30_00015 [Ignavibacteria bacterium RBG_16_36_9]